MGGTGKDIGIGELASLIASVTGFGGAIEFDATMPDGTPRKLLDVSRLRELGWEASIGLRDGIRQTHEWMAAHWRKITAG
jgi:GDP-L-fucose synthase